MNHNTDENSGNGKFRRQPGSFFVVDRSAWEALRTAAPTVKSVYLELCSMANEAGECWPSIATLASRIPCHRASVFRALDRLCDLRLIGHQKGSADGTTNRYCLVAPLRQPSRTTATTLVAPLRQPSRTTATQNEKQELDSGNETQRTRRKAGKPALARSDDLAFLIGEWNRRKLGPTVQADPIPAYAAKAWRRATEDPELRDIFRDQAAISALLDAAARNTWALEQPWWGLHSLFERDSSKTRWKAAKLLAVEYAGNGRAGVRKHHAAGRGYEYQPDQEGPSNVVGW